MAVQNNALTTSYMKVKIDNIRQKTSIGYVETEMK